MPSDRVVLRFDGLKMRRRWISSVVLVNGTVSSGPSLNCTRKNSSSGLVTLKNPATASADFDVSIPRWPTLFGLSASSQEGILQANHVPGYSTICKKTKI